MATLTVVEIARESKALKDKFERAIGESARGLTSTDILKAFADALLVWNSRID